MSAGRHHNLLLCSASELSQPVPGWGRGGTSRLQSLGCTLPRPPFSLRSLHLEPPVFPPLSGLKMRTTQPSSKGRLGDCASLPGLPSSLGGGAAQCVLNQSCLICSPGPSGSSPCRPGSQKLWHLSSPARPELQGQLHGNCGFLGTPRML